MRLFGQWYLVKDTSRPKDYPPRARTELVASRLRIDDLQHDLMLVQLAADVGEGIIDDEGTKRSVTKGRIWEDRPR